MQEEEARPGQARDGTVGVPDGGVAVVECEVLLAVRQGLLHASLVEEASDDVEGILMCHFVLVDRKAQVPA